MHHSDDKITISCWPLAISFSEVQTSSVCVYSDLGCCRKAVKEKISTKGQACLKPKVDIFYFNNSQSYPKSASARKKNEVFPRAFCTPCFFAKKRAVLRSQHLIYYIALLAMSHSAIWMALSAAPFLIWSATHQKVTQLGSVTSSRIRPTYTGSL